MLAATALVREVAEAFLPQRCALVDAVRRVGNHRRRGHAVVERCGVDERLDRRAGLALGLGRAVEVAQAAVEPALHRHDAAVVRVHRHESARHFRHRAHGPGAALRRHRDRVAGLEPVGRIHQRALLAAGETDVRRGSGEIGDHGDSPVLIVDAERRRGELLGQAALPRVESGDRPVPGIALRIAEQPGAQRIPRRVLHFGVERGAHPQSAGIDAVRSGIGRLAVLGDQLAAHFLEEIAGVGRARIVVLGDQAERLGLGGIGLGAGDVAVVDHLVEHPIAPDDRLVVVLRAAVVLGRLGQDGEERVLAQVELVDVLVEIGPRRRLHAEGTATERDLVEVEGDDFRLRQHAFDAPGEDHLLDLAGDRIFVADEDVLRHLLGDRRAALGALAGAELADVVEHRTDQTGDVDAAVGPEGLVLGRGVGVDQLGREILELQLDAMLAGIGIDNLAVDSANHRRQRRLVGQETAGIGQVAHDQDPGGEPQHHRRDQRHRRPAEPALGAPVVA